MLRSSKSKNTCSTDIIMLKRQPRNEKLQMHPRYVGEHKPKTSITNLEAAKEVLITAGKPIVENRRFERRNFNSM